jgi:Domain of unknown function (DUF1840)
MLIIFSSNATGDITMLGDDAERLINMMGHSGTIPSAIAAKDIPAVLERLKKVVETEADVPTDDDHMDVGGRVTPGAVTDDEDEPKVGIAGRAFPLIEMLSRAAKEDCSVMWRKK